MAPLPLETVSETTIVPANPVERRTHFLSNLDLVYDNQVFYAQIMFLFRGNGSLSGPEIVDSLKSSASKLLDVYPVLAGRLTKVGPYQRTAVDVNNQGIPFVEARCDAALGSLWGGDLRLCDADLQLNLPNTGIADLLEAPLIRFKVTLFTDGGVALGFSAMHSLVGGDNVVDLFIAWGQIHRGLPVARPPRFDTHLLGAREPPQMTRPLPDNLSFFDDDADLALEALGATKKLSRHTFEVSSEAVDALVADVAAGPFGRYTQRVSSYEALSALFWNAIARARVACGDVKPGVSHFTIPVSLTRPGRIDPALPDGYFGNAVIMTLATSTQEEIASQHMSYAAKLVHERSHSYEPEIAKSVIDQLEIRLREGKSMGISIGEGPPSGRDVLSTSFSAFPVYDIEFGFGRLNQLLFSFPLDIGEGLISTLPSPQGGRGRHVAVCLQEHHMKKLVEDPIFSKFCKY